jgi:hypothetical protein
MKQDTGWFRAWAAILFVIPVALGGWFLVERTRLEGSGAPELRSEVDLLPEGASDDIRGYATRCDEGEANACWILHGAWLGGRDGVNKSMLQARRLCRKACELGEREACDLWQRGASVCPLES